MNKKNQQHILDTLFPFWKSDNYVICEECNYLHFIGHDSEFRIQTLLSQYDYSSSNKFEGNYKILFGLL
jgi:hypothetical protein